MATAYQAFNSLLEMFVKELKNVFPQHKLLLDQAEDMLSMAIQANYKTPTTVFASHALPYAARIMERDETVLAEFDQTRLVPVELAPMWKDADEETQAVIWQYLQSIAFLGGGLAQMDEEGMQMVDSMTKTIQQTLGL